MRITLIRHPQPLVAAGVCYGSTDLQVEQAQINLVLAALAGTLPVGAPLYSSPLQRCAALAKQLATTPPKYDARLAEMHFGTWEMQRWDDIPRTEIDAWAAAPAHYHPGGGESVLQMATRVASFYAALRTDAPSDAIIVCHAGTIRLLMACHAGLAPADMAQHAASTPHSIAYGAQIVLQD
ncbi:histidine phosphatase family protein [Rugamonas apoptosis]|uniref:Histidine phosphatase family protein n=1 Tax=Rugamonas apoptosis TaxID=2758570 RepID=A0A7W2FFB6_9BURK|nr:histidine phosphatase family protein [Rugamonas apoptosis]MBA5690688.1 histidine phosphatase family protein [Rugamonas apoptosis]